MLVSELRVWLVMQMGSCGREDEVAIPQRCPKPVKLQQLLQHRGLTSVAVAGGSVSEFDLRSLHTEQRGGVELLLCFQFDLF